MGMIIPWAAQLLAKESDQDIDYRQRKEGIPDKLCVSPLMC